MFCSQVADKLLHFWIFVTSKISLKGTPYRACYSNLYLWWHYSWVTIVWTIQFQKIFNQFTSWSFAIASIYGSRECLKSKSLLKDSTTPFSISVRTVIRLNKSLTSYSSVLHRFDPNCFDCRPYSSRHQTRFSTDAWSGFK